jgi:hypothetical protein
LITELLVGFRTDGPRSRTADENRKEWNPNPLRDSAWQAELMERKAGTNPAQFRGLESKKNPATGEVFFLTSPFIELIGS